jgi:hypothetical protein
VGFTSATRYKEEDRERIEGAHKPRVDYHKWSVLTLTPSSPNSQLLGRSLSAQQALDPFNIGMHDSRFPQILEVLQDDLDKAASIGKFDVLVFEINRLGFLEQSDLSADSRAPG